MNKIKEEIYQVVYDTAIKLGMEAGNKSIPIPMVVEQHENPLNDNSPVEKRYIVNDGVCGFAWVIIQPGTSSFARWLVKNRHGSKSSYGGVSLWIRGHGQSYERKMSSANAMAKYFNSVGIDAFANGRLD